MSTGTNFVDIHRKRLLGTTDFSTRLLDHLRTLVQESYERSYRTGVIYDSALTLSGAAADAFAIGGTSLATDGLGHLLDIATFGFQSSVKFENTLSQDYQVGLAYTEVPDGIQINTGTGLPEYIGTQEAIGDSADPDAVTDNGGTITFQIDSVCESGVTHAGRKARVYLKTPAKNAITEALAIEELTVAYTAGQNRITTAGTLGQDTVSTDPADYTVVLLGPTVKRNATIKATDGYAYIGTITGAGAGSTPSSFDITEQEVMAGSLSQLSHITRVASNDRLKVDVKAITGESGEDQIRVTDSTGAIKFKVDEAGNVTIEGNLEVTGTTTQNDIVIVNSSETITDNLTAGDNDASDSHVIKGEWKHTNTAGTANYFTVDGDTGRIGIGALYNASWGLNIGGTVRALDLFRIESAAPTLQFRETDIAVNAGGLWRWTHAGGDLFIQENTAAGGDFGTEHTWIRLNRSLDGIMLGHHVAPSSDDAYDLGLAANQWRNLYLDGVAYVDTLSLDNTDGLGIASHAKPTTDGDKHLGGTNRYWQYLYVHSIFTKGNVVPSPDDTHDLGTAANQWRNLYVDGTAYVDTLSLSATAGEGCATDFNPTADGTLDLGSPSRQWANVYTVNLNVGSDINPASDLAYDLGQSANRWLNLYVRNIDGGPAVTDYISLGGPVYIGTYDAPPVGSMNGAYTAQITTGAQANWATYLENGQGRVNITWNAYYDGTNWRAWKGTGSGDGATRLNVADTSGAMSWKFYFDDTSPASDGAVLSLATLTTEISSSGIWVKHKIQIEDTAAELWFRETDYAVNAGGLYRQILAGADWVLQENTAAGGDFSTTRAWIRADQSATSLVIGAHLKPSSTGYDLGGGGANEWRALYLSDSAGQGVVGNLVPTADATVNLGNSDYRWGTFFATLARIISATPRVQFEDTDIAVDAGGLYRLIGNTGDFYLQENTAVAGDFSTSRTWWYADRSASAMKIGGHLMPNATGSYDFGGSSNEWRALYLSDAAGHGVAGHFVPTADNVHLLGSSSYRWSNVYAGIITAQSGLPYICLRETDVAETSGGRWRAILSIGNLYLQENTAAGGDFSTIFNWFHTDRANSAMDFGAHVWPDADDTYDLGDSARQWRNLYVDGTAYIDILSLSTAASEGVGSHLYPDADDSYDLGSATREFRNLYVDGTALIDILSISTTAGEGFGSHVYPTTTETHKLGTSGRLWAEVACKNMLLFDTDDTVTSTAVNWYRAATTVNNQTLTMASFIAQTDVTALDGFGASWKFWLNTAGGLFNVGVFEWERIAASDQANMTWSLRDASDAMVAVLGIQYNGYVRTRHLTPYVNSASDLGTSVLRYRHAYIDGTIYIDDDTSFYIQRNGTNPYFNFDTGQDAFWYSRASDRFYFRINGDDTIFRIDATVTQVGGNFTPYTTNVRTLGDSTHVWLSTYTQDLYLTGTSGTFARKVFYPLNVGDANGIAMALQSGGTFYIGSGESAATVSGGVGDTTNESLYLCADATMSFWTGANAPYAASDRKMHIDSDGLIYIANGGAPTSGGAAKLNIGNVGTAGTTDLRGSHVNIYDGTTLSSTIDTRRRLWAVGGASSNESWLTISQYRIIGAAGWENAGFRIAHEVDNSADVGGYIQFGVNEFKIKGDWYPESDGAWELGTTSYRWKHLYTTFQNTTLVSTTLTSPCAVFTRDPDTVGNNYYPVVRFNNAPSSAAATVGSAGYLDFQTEGTACARIYWKYATANRTCNLAFALDNGSVFADRLQLTYDGYAEFQCHLHPTAANTYDLGSAGAYWQDTFTQNLWWKGTHTTFDDQDDLALIDAYEPLESETVEVEKAGVARKVQITKANLPWPMLGVQDPNGEAFIHGADALTFLVGAIKQLHGKHKSEIASLKEQMATMAAKLEALTA